MISTAGVSGHARVMNFGGDNINIAHIHDSSGTGTSTALATIKDRLMIVHDREIGKSSTPIRFSQLRLFLDDKIYDWLVSPDVYSNYNAARRKHHPGTGSWFLTGELYSTWRRNADNIVCIYGDREYSTPYGLSPLKDFFASWMWQDNSLVRTKSLIPCDFSLLYLAHPSSKTLKIYASLNNYRATRIFSLIEETLVMASFSSRISCALSFFNLPPAVEELRRC